MDPLTHVFPGSTRELRAESYRLWRSNLLRKAEAVAPPTEVNPPWYRGASVVDPAEHPFVSRDRDEVDYIAACNPTYIQVLLKERDDLDTARRVALSRTHQDHIYRGSGVSEAECLILPCGILNGQL